MKMVIFQQSRFLALVSNGDRLAELSAAAADSQDAATLQILKTMDSIEFKSQQLQTSLQTLYTESGIQDMYKNVLDFAKVIIDSFTSMPKVINMPIAALVRFGMAFKDLANVVIATVSYAQSVILTKANALKGKIASTEADITNIKAQNNAQQVADYQAAQNQMAQAAEEAARKQAALEAKAQADRAKALQSVALSGASLGVGIIGSNLKNKEDRQSQFNGGVLSTLSSSLSFASIGASMELGAAGMVGITAMGAVLGIIENYNILFDTIDNRLKRTTEIAENKRNEAIQSRDEEKQLSNSIDKLKELEKHQYDSTEAYEEYIQAMGELASKYPELIDSYNSSGEAIVKTVDAEEQLQKARDASVVATREAAVAEYNRALTQQKKADEEAKKEMNKSSLDILAEQEFSIDKDNKIKGTFQQVVEGIVNEILETSGENTADEALMENLGLTLDQAIDFYSLTIPDLPNYVKDHPELSEALNSVDTTYSRYISDVIDQLNGIQKAYGASIIKNKEVAEKVLKTQFASYAQSLIRLEDNSAISNLENVNKIFSDILIKNYDGGDFQAYLDGKGTTLIQQTIKDFEQIFKNRLITDSEQNKLNDLIKNANNYTRKEFREKLEGLIIGEEKEIQKVRNLILDSAFEDNNLTELTFSKAQIQQSKSNPKGISARGVKGLGSGEYKSILDIFNTINGYSDKSLSQKRAQELYDTYINLWNFTTSITGEEKDTIQGILSKVDELSASSIEKLIKDLENLGFTDENYQAVHDKAEELFKLVPKNLNTEIESYRQSVSDTASDYEKALSNASKGMDFKTATELAAKLKINLSDFTLENGKFFTDDYNAIYNAFYEELSQKEKDNFQLIKDSVKNAKSVLANKTDPTQLKDIEDKELGDLNLNRADLEEILKNSKKLEIPVNEAIEKFYGAKYQEIVTASNYLKQQLDSALVSNNLTSFLEVQLKTYGKPDLIEDTIKNIIAGNVPGQLSEFGAILIQTYGNTAKNTYEAAIKALGGESQTIQVTAANRSLLKELGFKGIDGSELRIGETAYLQRAQNASEYATQLQDSIKSSYLNKEDQEKLLNSIVTAQQELYNSVESLIGKQSSGFKSVQDLQTYLNSLTTIYKDYTVTLENGQINIGELNFDEAYKFDRNLNAYVLTGNALTAQMAVLHNKIITTLVKGTNEYEAAMANIKLNINSLADSINIKDFLDAEDNSKDSVAEQKLRKSIEDYNVAAILFKDELKTSALDIDKVTEALRTGGISGVNAAKAIADLQGKTLTKAEIESIYNKPVTRITNTLETINKGIGAILTEEELKLLGVTNILKETRVANVGDLALQRLGDTDEWVITSAENLTEAHTRLYERLANTNTATAEEINKVAAQSLTDPDKNRIKAVNAVKNALDMTYEEFGTLLGDAGYAMSEDLINLLDSKEIIERLGNGNLRINDFASFAEFLNLDTTSEAFTSVFKTYNDGLITLNKRVEKAVAAEVKSIVNAKPGDWLNFTEFESKISQLDDATQLRILAILQAYGGQLENGILKIDENAKILNLAKAISEITSEQGLILERDFHELEDAIENLLTNLVNLINTGIKGTLSNADARSLQETAKTFNVNVSFQKTSEGLRLSSESAQELYFKIKQVDTIQSTLIFKELRTSLESADGACKNISTTLANIKRLQDDINKASGNEVDVLKRRLDLYQEIARAQMSTAEQYDFMGRKLPSGMQGPLNYWDSIGKMFKTINEAIYGEKGSKNKKKKSQKGYIGVQDFYNIVTELNNMAAISGTSITFLGQKLDGDLETAANLIQKGFGALANVKGEGTKIALSKLGENLGVGADILLKDVEGGIKGMAEANIKMLDAQIQMLEGIVALEQLGDIDINGSGTIDLDEIFATDINGNINRHKFSEPLEAARKAIVEANAENKEFQKVMNTFYVDSVKLGDILNASADELNDMGFSGEKLAKVLTVVSKAAKDGNFALDGSNLIQVLTEALGDSMTITLNDGVFVVSVGANNFTIDISKINPEDFQKATGKTIEELQHILNKAAIAPEELTIDQEFVLQVAAGNIKVEFKPSGVQKFVAGGQEYETENQAMAALAFMNVGWKSDSKQLKDQKGSQFHVQQAYGRLEVELNYDVDTRKTTYKYGNYTDESLNGLIAQINNLESTDKDYDKKLTDAKIYYGIELAPDIEVNKGVFESAGKDAIDKAREILRKGISTKDEIEHFASLGISFYYNQDANGNINVLNKTQKELEELFKIDINKETLTDQLNDVNNAVQEMKGVDLTNLAGALSSIAKSFESIATANLEKLGDVFKTLTGVNGNAEGQTAQGGTNLVTNLGNAIEKIGKIFTDFNTSVGAATTAVNSIIAAIKELNPEVKLTVNKDDFVNQVARVSLPSKTIKLYADVNDILTKINNLPKSISVKVDASTTTTPTSTVNSLTSQAAFSTLTGQSQAKGTLMGELGPELYVTNGRYYIAGQNGAEFVDLPDDAIVFNHLQTKKLFNGDFAGHGSPVVSERRSTSYATGNVNGGDALASASEALASLKQIRAMWQAMIDASMKDLGSQAGRSGGGGKNDPSKTNAGFIADLERWYNLLRQIAKLEEKISYEQKLQAKITSDTVNRNGSALYSSYKRELDYLDQEIAKNMELSDLQKSYYEARRKDLADSEFGKIFTFNKEGLMQYNDNAILANGQRGGLFALAELNSQNADGSTRYSAKEQYNLLKGWGFETAMKYDNTGKEIVLDADSKNADDYYTKSVQAFWDKVDGWKDELDELYDSYNSKLEDILDNEASRNKILQAIIDNQLSVEDSVIKAIEDREQAIIDALQDERDAVEKNNQKFLEGLNEQLNRERDMYQRQQENDELISLRRQLAILQRSGGSASQIRNLQEQINTQEREKYFNTQQDQIDAIEKASNVQIERLDAQIELMTETLEYQKEHGLLWNEVYEIMNKSESEIADFIMSNGKEWMAKSSLQIDNDLNTLRGEIGQWIAYRKDQDKKSGDMSNSWNNYTSGVANRYSSVWTPENVAAAMAAFNAEYNQSADPNRAAAAANAIFESKLSAYMANQPSVPQEYKAAASSSSSTSSSGGNGGSSGSGGSSSGSSSGKTTTTATNTSSVTTNGSGPYTVSYYIPSTGQTIVNRFSTAEEAQKYRQDLVKSSLYQSGQVKLATYNAPSSSSSKTTASTTTSSNSGATNGVHGYKITQYGKVVQESGPRYATREAAQAAAKAIVAKLPGGKYTTYDRGGMVDEDQLALVHAGEAVLTAKQTETLRNAVLNTRNKSSVISLLMNWRDSMERVINNATDGAGANGITIENATVEMNVGSIANDYDARRAGSEALNEMLRIARQTKVQSVRR